MSNQHSPKFKDAFDWHEISEVEFIECSVGKERMTFLASDVSRAKSVNYYERATSGSLVKSVESSGIFKYFICLQPRANLAQFQDNPVQSALI